jgi:hypothetical protein
MYATDGDDALSSVIRASLADLEVSLSIQDTLGTQGKSGFHRLYSQVGAMNAAHSAAGLTE